MFVNLYVHANMNIRSQNHLYFSEGTKRIPNKIYKLEKNLNLLDSCSQKQLKRYQKRKSFVEYHPDQIQHTENNIEEVSNPVDNNLKKKNIFLEGRLWKKTLEVILKFVSLF